MLFSILTSASLLGIIVVAVLAVIILFVGIYVVPQQSVFIIERFGKFHRLADPGIHVKIPLVDRIATKVSMRIHQMDQSVTTKTVDNVFVNLNVSVQYRVDDKNIAASFYELSSPETQIRAYVEDNIRNAVPTLTLDDAFVQKDKTLITDIEPDAAVRDAMNSINESQRRKEAARELAEADKITVVVKAEAEAEQARLHGMGIANQRKAIVDGLHRSFEELKQDGMTESEIMSIILTEQYLDVLSRFADSPNMKVLMMPSDISAVGEMQQSIIASIEATNGLQR